MLETRLLSERAMCAVQSLGVDSPQLAAFSQRPIQSPSFPHVLSGNPGQSGSGPRTKKFRGDGMGGVRMIGLRYPAACCGVVHCSKVQGSVQRERAVLRTSNFEPLFRSLLHPTARFVINISSRAGVVEWQTRRTQNSVGVPLEKRGVSDNSPFLFGLSFPAAFRLFPLFR